MVVDFHMHSTFSDGVETPAELLRHSREKGLSVIALTDHDEIEGIKLLLAKKPEHMQIVTGCEFSASYKNKDVHILGYGFDIGNKGLLDFITYVKEKRISRIHEIIRRCNEHGYAVTIDDLTKTFPDTRAYGRPHVAKLLIDKGYAADVQDVFDRILNSESPCYVPKVKVPVNEILDIIHHADGLAVLAHPKLIRNDEYVKELLDYDFDGIEVYHSKHDDRDIKKYARMAKAKGLLQSGGSDYHGTPNRYPYYLGEYTVQSEHIIDFMRALHLAVN